MQLGLRPSCQLIWLLAVATLLGCNDSPPSTAPAAADPAASFARVVQNLHHYLRQLESDPYTTIEDGAYTDIRHSREVTHQEFKPPAEKGGEFRGTITVTTKWIYSFRPSTETEKEQPKPKDDEAQPPLPEHLQDSGQAGDVEILDPSVVADLPRTPPRDSSALATNLGMSDADQEAHTFHFVFRDNRWELVPQPLKPIKPGTDASGLDDTNTNQSVEEAVELALKRQ